MVLLGWNLDSMLRAELNDQQEMISLFEPAYPSENSLRAIVNSDNSRQSKRYATRLAFQAIGSNHQWQIYWRPRSNA